MGPFFILAAIILGYFIYEKIFKMYYIIWFYKRQGVKLCSYPLPILGDAY